MSTDESATRLVVGCNRRSLRATHADDHRWPVASAASDGVAAQATGHGSDAARTCGPDNTTDPNLKPGIRSSREASSPQALPLAIVRSATTPPAAADVRRIRRRDPLVELTRPRAHPHRPINNGSKPCPTYPNG